MRDLQASKRTFRDCALDLSTLHNDVVIVEALLLLDQIVGVSSVLAAVVRRRSLRRELDAADDDPLDERECDSDDGGHRDQDLRKKTGENRRSHDGSGRRDGGNGRITYGESGRKTGKKKGGKKQTARVLGFSLLFYATLIASPLLSAAYIGRSGERKKRKESRIL